MACRRSSRSGENPSDSGVAMGNGCAAGRARPGGTRRRRGRQAVRRIGMARDSIKQPVECSPGDRDAIFRDGGDGGDGRGNEHGSGTDSRGDQADVGQDGGRRGRGSVHADQRQRGLGEDRHPGRHRGLDQGAGQGGRARRRHARASTRSTGTSAPIRSSASWWAGTATASARRPLRSTARRTRWRRTTASTPSTAGARASTSTSGRRVRSRRPTGWRSN